MPGSPAAPGGAAPGSPAAPTSGSPAGTTSSEHSGGFGALPSDAPAQSGAESRATSYAGPESPGDAPATDATGRLPAFGATPSTESGWATAQGGWQGQQTGQPGAPAAPGQPYGQPGQPGAGPHSGEIPKVYGEQPATAYQPGAPYQPGQPGEPGQPGMPVPAAGGKSGGGKGLWIALIIGAVVVLVLALIGVWMWLGRGPDYSVGDCVKEGSGRAVESVSCDDKDAFKVTNKVKSEADCKDSDAVVNIEEGGKTVEVLCLKKVH